MPSVPCANILSHSPHICSDFRGFATVTSFFDYDKPPKGHSAHLTPRPKEED
ncbi:hypothetical protein FOQG_18718 [Fusarium oxysporum f. sp. raphani 54005]|uniref:Uncharacterized protein n=2 Tax=Fusarium oxysporum TaxID=5507 RepID=X0C179_FUSOX|nr:hypothetical protein FOQG_18718 [Fusarium oxysporum f. sp. raphani 54005]EXM13806.1 hypothetical protein FOTG_17764 [Fusarium oxysporum f. sp. vasinfectum 25433]